MAENRKKKILVIGLTCVDLVSICDGFPEEDSDRRCVDQIWQRGGNASNTSSVIAILGAHVECMVSIADAHEKAFILQDFDSYGIQYKHSVIHPGCKTPLAVVIINRWNGSRTILPVDKNLPEVAFEDFKRIDLSEEQFSWVHIEARPGRGKDACEMLHQIDNYNHSLRDTSSKTTTSVEIEKNRSQLGMLMDKADYVFIGKEFAKGRGCTSKEHAIRTLLPETRPGSTLICAWGEDGAAAAINNSNNNRDPLPAMSIISVPICEQPKVVDTLGAGDTFNAATIFALSHGHDLKTALNFGCKVAGTKCGIQGFRGLRDYTFQF